MRIFTYGKFSIVCEYKSTRSGFRHIAVLLKNGIEQDRGKCCYQNRTWEKFTYESVLHKVIDKTTTLTTRQKAGFKRNLNKKYGY